MRRKIKIAADNSRIEEQKQNSEAFERWLAKKRAEAERSEEEDNEDSDEATDDEEDKLREFNKRVRKMNRIERKTLTPGNRPLADVIDVGKSSPSEENIVPSPYEHITAHKEYVLRKRMGRKGGSNAHVAGDITTEKRLLEERRQRLLYSAITYDEWLDHSEERKQLINRILKANMQEMKKIEEEKFNYRLRHFKYEDWKVKAEKREAEIRKQRALEKKWEEEEKAERFYVSSIAPTFDEWVKSKKSQTEKVPKHESAAKKTSNKPTRTPGEIDTAYDAWLVKKHKEEMDKINSQGYHARIQTVR